PQIVRALFVVAYVDVGPPKLTERPDVEDARTAGGLMAGDGPALHVDGAIEFAEPLIADARVGEGDGIHQLRLEVLERQRAFEKLKRMVEAAAIELAGAEVHECDRFVVPIALFLR